jgi:eukaryotic-like serine/threonine-protein kinase
MSDTPGEVTPPPAECRPGRQSALATVIPLAGAQCGEEARNSESDEPDSPNSVAHFPQLSSAQPVSRGQVLNGYRILEWLGTGGMGLVYRAMDTRLDRQVALKFLPLELDLDEHARAALVDEARAASALDHPNIGTIHGIEETASGHRFIVMAFYEGQTLEEKLRRGPVTVKEAAAIALQVANGLAEAHAHRIVHRDIKPSNIFLTRQGLVKILDFGIARVIRTAASTRSVHISGTAAYMSPQQAQGKFLDARTDLWSLGAVLYEMVAGRRAFAAESFPATLLAVVNDPAPDLGEDVPHAFQKIIYRALAKQAEDRYQSAAEMIQDLRQVSGLEVAVCDPTVTLEHVKQAAGSPAARKERRYPRWPFIPLLFLTSLAVFLSGVRSRGPKPAAYQSYLEARGQMQRYDRPENVDRAVILLQQAVKADPNFALALASLGEAYLLKFRATQDPARLAEAESNSRRALQLNDSLAEVHIAMGEVQSAMGNRELALDHYQHALKLDPSNANALSGLAGEYAARQRTREAEELYRRAAALRPDDWQGYNALGRFLKAQKRPQEAGEQFRRVIRLTPDNVAGYLNLAAVLIDQGRLDQAQAPLERASELAPSNYVVHLNLGELYSRKRLFPQAERSLQRALRFNDKRWTVWLDLAVVYRWMNQDSHAVAAYQHAVPLLEEAVKVTPKDAPLRALLAEMYAYTGQSDRSLSSIQASLALDAEDVTVLLSCADAYAAMGNHSLAAAMANKAVANGLTLAALNADPEARRFRSGPTFTPPTK